MDKSLCSAEEVLALSSIISPDLGHCSAPRRALVTLLLRICDKISLNGNNPVDCGEILNVETSMSMKCPVTTATQTTAGFRDDKRKLNIRGNYGPRDCCH